MSDKKRIDTNKLKSLRSMAGYSQSEAAFKLGLSLTSFHGKENGHIEFKCSELAQLSEIYGVTMEELFKTPLTIDVPIRLTHQNPKALKALKSVLNEFAGIIVEPERHIQKINKLLQHTNEEEI